MFKVSYSILNYLEWDPSTYDYNITLLDAYRDMNRYSMAQKDSIPFIVQLFENPKYDFFRFGLLQGSISLFSHDLLHILLQKNMSMHGEAYVIGYTMGSTKKTSKFDIFLFEHITRFLYPKSYRFDKKAIKSFKHGIIDGYAHEVKDLHKIDYTQFMHKPLTEVRKILKINIL